ncbi:CBS domain-containing protein [Mesorhizobium sp. ORM6]
MPRETSQSGRRSTLVKPPCRAKCIAQADSPTGSSDGRARYRWTEGIYAVVGRTATVVSDTKPGSSDMMRIENLLAKVRDRLLVIGDDRQLTEAASLLSDDTRHMVVVCDSGGGMAGVITRTDIVAPDTPLPRMRLHDGLYSRHDPERDRLRGE